MPTHETLIGLVAFAAGFGLIFTRIARGVANSVGFVDAPDGQRKKQTKPIPVAGGLAVLSATLVTLLIVALEDPTIAEALTADLRKSFALLAGAVLITFVGVIDDRYNLRARIKFAGQLSAILVLVVGGDFVIHSIGLFGFRVQLGWLDIPFTVFWLLACVNALNLIDGMDGLLGTVGAIALISLAIIAAMTGHMFAAIVALALAGGIMGFLWLNLPPATIYMGDAGSMLIGFVIGAVAIPAGLKGPAMISLGAPLAILILPVFDTTAAIIRRKLTGRGIAMPDCGHLHHKMMDRGLTPSRVLTIVAGLGSFAAAGALLSVAWSDDLFALVAAGSVMVTMVVSKLFGNAELGLIRTRVSKFVRKLLLGDASSWGLSVQLQGSADWERIWTELTSLAGRLQLQSLCLNVNSPALRENYHARWNNPVTVHVNQILQLEIPLLGKNGMPLGRLAISVTRDARPISEAFATITRLVETFELGAAGLTGLRVQKAAPSQTTVLDLVPVQRETVPA